MVDQLSSLPQTELIAPELLSRSRANTITVIATHLKCELRFQWQTAIDVPRMKKIVDHTPIAWTAFLAAVLACGRQAASRSRLTLRPPADAPNPVRLAAHGESWMRRRSYHALVAIGLMCAGCTWGEQQQQPNELTPTDDGKFSELTALNAREERATSLDGLPPIDGVAALDSVSTLLWSTTEKTMWLLHDAKLQQFDLGATQTTPAAVERVAERPSTLRIIDARKAKAITIKLTDGRVLLEESLEVRDSIIAAAAIRGATYLIRKPSSGQLYLTVTFSNGPDTSVTALTQLRPLAFPGSPVLISVSARGALVTSRSWPFHIWSLRPDSPDVRLFAPLSESWLGDSLAAYGRSSLWIAGPALHLNRGILLGLTNLATDAKALIVLDNEGRVLRLHFSQLPIGFIASEPQSRRLFAIRYAGSTELVRYRY